MDKLCVARFNYRLIHRHETQNLILGCLIRCLTEKHLIFDWIKNNETHSDNGGY